MGNSYSLIFKVINKALYKKDDSYVWVVKNGDKIIKSLVSVKISVGFDNYSPKDIIVHNRENKFYICQYLDYKYNGMYVFNTIYGIYPISDDQIKKYEVKSLSSQINGFRYNVYVLEI